MAQYPRPTGNTGTFNNQSFVSPDTGGLTIDEAKQYFVTFPNTQSPSTIVADNFNTTGSLNVAGDSQFGGDVTFIGGVSIAGGIVFENDVEVTGTTTLDDNLLCLTTATITDLLTCQGGIDISTVGDGITFPDNTTQTTAFIEANYAQLNTDNIFLPTFTNTFQGTVNLGNSASTSGLTLNNNTLSYLLQPILAGTNYGLTIINALSNNSILSLSNGGANAISMTCTGPQVLEIDGSVGVDNLSIISSFGTTALQYYTLNNLSLNMGSNSDTFYIQNPTGNIMTFSNTEIDALKNFNMNSQNIIGIGALGGNGGNITCNSNLIMGTGNGLNMQTNNINNVGTLNGSAGGTLIIGTQSATNCSLAGGSFTAGLSLNVSSANGGFNMLYYTANNLSLNMRVNETFQIQNAGVSLMTLSPISGINSFQNLGMNGNDISMLGGDILGCNSITNVTGTSFVTTNTPLSTDSSTKIATTAFVKQFAPSYTQSSFTLQATSPTYYTMSPTPVFVISTYASGNNTASFNNVPFVLTCVTAATSLAFNLEFNTAPFVNYPPPGSLYMTVSCSNGSTYTCNVVFAGGNTAYCILNGGPSVTLGMTFTCNLATIGAFIP